jgi:predicted nucleic acid-binding protein
MRVYLDAAPIIYLVEQNTGFSPAVAAKLAALGGDLVSSDLAWMESLVVPYRNNNLGVVADFDDFFRNRLTAVFALDRTVFDRAARIRATYPFKTPDALHLAVRLRPAATCSSPTTPN